MPTVSTSDGTLRIALVSPSIREVEAFVSSDEVLDVNVMIAYR